MTPDELTEKVALVLSGVEWCGAQINGVRVLCDDPHLPEDVRQGECLCRRQAPIAIAVCMEEAAKEADQRDDGSSEEGPLTAYHIAAAIRAMIPKDSADG